MPAAPTPTKTKAKGRATKDKWKSKNWYNVMAPDMFNRQKVAETLTDEPDKLVGRIAEVTVQDINGDFSKMHIKLRFKVNDVRGTEAHTYFVGHDMSSDYVRRMTRRRKSKIDMVVDVKTRDDYIIRLKPLAISGNRVRSSQQSEIRHILENMLTEFCTSRPLDEIVKAIISGQLAKTAAAACKPIHPLQRVEIHKSEILKPGFIPEVPDAPEGGEPLPLETASDTQPEAEESEVIEESEVLPESESK
jgi:small subunit ribosomal protein S3Ae